MTVSQPNWLQLAYSEMGVQEVPGPGNNPRILAYFRACGASAEWADKDSIPWCGAFMGFLMNSSGYHLPTTPLLARDWLNWGDVVSKPYTGCVAVLQRGGDPKQGHVAIFLWFSDDGRYVYLLGGNQGDRVCIEKYLASNILGYRVPTGYKPPGLKAVMKDSRIMKEGRDLVVTGVAGGAAKGAQAAIDKTPVETAQETVNQALTWKWLADQLVDLLHFVGDNFVLIMVLVLVWSGARILYYRYQDYLDGKTMGMN